MDHATMVVHVIMKAPTANRKAARKLTKVQ